MKSTIKPAKIRPGQRVPYRKGTKAEINQRLRFVARMMNTVTTKTKIHQAVREKFHIEWRQCDRYMSKLLCEWAREALSFPVAIKTRARAM